MSLAPIACAAALCLAAAPAAQAQDRTIVAGGTGQVTVTPKDRKSDNSIAAAVKKAYDAALPKAIADAREEAGELATAAGVTLGALVTVSNVPAQPFYGGFFGGGPQLGTFGPGKFCGTVRRAIIRTTKSGRRRVVGTRSRHTCRVPSTITRNVTLTFAIAGA
jgi:Protein of unknown function (DUF541)